MDLPVSIPATPRWVTGPRAIAFAAGLLVGVPLGVLGDRMLPGGTDPSPGEIRRQEEIERLTERYRRQQGIAARMAAAARSADSAASVLRDSLADLRARETRERREARRAAVRAGDTLRATLDSIEAVLPEIHEPLVAQARRQAARRDSARLVQIESLRVELDTTRALVRQERSAKRRWRSAYTELDSVVGLLRAQRDSLTVSRNYWRGEARTDLLERLSSGWMQGLAKAGAVALACHPDTRLKGSCAAAGGMWAVDALTEGLP